MKSKGFTLIELLVVVAIISLLSSIVLASLGEARDKAKGTAFRQGVEQLIRAIELYRADNNGQIPLNLTSSGVGFISFHSTGWTQSSSGNPSTNVNLFISEISDYLEEIPRSPFKENATAQNALLVYKRNNVEAGTCSGTGPISPYLILVEISGKNADYFSDWIPWNASPNQYRCFSF